MGAGGAPGAGASIGADAGALPDFVQAAGAATAAINHANLSTPGPCHIICTSDSNLPEAPDHRAVATETSALLICASG
jgi:hypothetical protein